MNKLAHPILATWLVFTCGVSAGGAQTTPPVADAPLTLSAREVLHRRPYPPRADRELLLDEYLELIRNLPLDYGKVGSVLEGLARVYFSAIYPPEDFDILSNITYQDREGRTLGELDLVVFERNTGEAVLVAEAKVGRKLRRAAQRAAAQLARFRFHLDAGDIASFSARQDTKRAILPGQFLPVTEYVRVGARGALGAGFEYEADITRDEADELQSRLKSEKARQRP